MESVQSSGLTEPTSHSDSDESEAFLVPDINDAQLACFKQACFLTQKSLDRRVKSLIEWDTFVAELKQAKARAVSLNPKPSYSGHPSK